MIGHTIEEAQRMICPYLKYTISIEPFMQEHSVCTNRECPMWRWIATVRVKPGAVGYSKDQYEDIPVPERRGFCGLAGTPCC